jgi:hypothetical protein
MQNILQARTGGGKPGSLAGEDRRAGLPAKEGEAMAVKRALMFRMGSQGLTCAAYEVAVEPGTEVSKGTIKPVRDCTKPATEVVKETGLCSDCAAILRKSPQLSVVRQTRRGDVIA